MSCNPPPTIEYALGKFGSADHPGYKLTEKVGYFPYFMLETWEVKKTGEIATYTEERLRDLCEEQLKRGRWWPDGKFMRKLYGVKNTSELLQLY